MPVPFRGGPGGKDMERRTVRQENMSAWNLYAETVLPHGHGTTPTPGQAMPQLEEQYGMVTSKRIPRVAISNGATEAGRAEDGHRTTDGIAGRSALEARSLHGDGAVVRSPQSPW